MTGDLILPDAFVSRMESVLGAELPAFIEALAAPAEGLRVNELRLSGDDFLKITPFALQSLAIAPEAFTIEPGARAGKHPYHAAGLYYLQDPGAMAVGALVEARPGERVLDLAAAPGGKATHLAARMRGEGLLVANDVSRPRAQELARNMERCGVTNAIVTAESVQRLADHFGAYFDRVLVDAPCSGESMFHKSEAARADWSPESVAGCARRQDEILHVASRLVAPGGCLYYSTCTFSVEENESVIDSFLEGSDDFEPAALPPLEGAEAARIGSEMGGGPSAYRLWPHRVPGAGHFVATLRRRNGGEQIALGGGSPPGPDREGVRLFRAFTEDRYPDVEFDAARLATFGRELHLLPKSPIPTSGLRVLRSGLWLGTLERNRFEPSHALALASAPYLTAAVVELRVDDPRVEHYLAGHPIEAEGSPGWVPVSVGRFRLGWGKRVGSMVKNHYPKGLRTRG